MIDPITAMAAASAAYSGIKKAVSVGREISGMAGTISQWSKACSDLDFLDKKAQKPDNCINWAVGLVAVFTGAGILAVAVYFIGANQGKW